MIQTNNSKLASFFAFFGCIAISGGSISNFFSLTGGNIEIVIGAFFFITFCLPLWFKDTYQRTEYKIFAIYQLIALEIYPLTADQFGYIQGKKLPQSRFSDLLVSKVYLPFNKKHEAHYYAYRHWSSENEQVSDVFVMFGRL